MANLLLPLLAAYADRTRANFIPKTRRIMAVQEQFLHQLLKIQRDTELGQKFGLSDIKTIDRFRHQVPIWPYERYEPYTERIARGEHNVLTADPVVYISLTSGTTGKQKMVPVTRRFQNSLRRPNLVSIGFALAAMRQRNCAQKGLRSVQRQPAQDLKFGKLLTTNSAIVQGLTSGGIEYGPVTVGSLRMGKLIYQQTFVTPYEALEISDSLSRHYVCLLFALRDPQLRGIVANFPMLILRTCNYLERYAEDLIQDLAAGTLASWLKLDPTMRATLEQQCAAAPARAAQLRHILQSEGQLTPKAAWPGLSYIATARGGTSDFYFERFPSYFGDTPIFGGVYGSAEATFGIYHDFDQDSSILAIENGFYEFIPVDQWNAEQPKTLLPIEVKVGECYRILVTSYSGFYRYDIGDVVEVVGFYEQTPLIAFRYRRGGLLSSTTEKTTEFHATQVMQALQQEFDESLEDFCITLSDQEVPAAYLVNIELTAGKTLDNPVDFLASFERWLIEFNNPYGTVRMDQVPPPRLRILAPGSFAIVRQRQIEKGTSDSQLKFPHISEDRYFLRGLTVLQEVSLY